MAVAGSEQIPAAWRAAAVFLRHYNFGEDMPTALANVSLDDKYTFTSGRIYLSGVQALVRMPAIELNGVGVESNKKSFAWGRRAAVNLDRVARVALPEPPVSITPLARQNIDALVRHRMEILTGYQDAVYAHRYESLVTAVREAESRLGLGNTLSLAEPRSSRCLPRCRRTTTHLPLKSHRSRKRSAASGTSRTAP
jgi:hypothetical protein